MARPLPPPPLLNGLAISGETFFCGFPKKKERNVGFPKISKINKLISNKICETKVSIFFVFIGWTTKRGGRHGHYQGAGRGGLTPLPLKNVNFFKTKYKKISMHGIIFFFLKHFSVM